jgi:pimeloyl-ACP methyl ester carboxylesterase
MRVYQASGAGWAGAGSVRAGGHPLPDQVHHGRVGQGGHVADRAVLGHVAQQPAHDLAGAGLRLFARDVAQAPPQILAALSASTPTPADSADERRGAIGTLHDLEALAEDTLDPRRWGHLTVPVLLMRGADTWEPMPSTMRALAAALGDPERVIWPGQTHFATATAPALVADTLRGFFTRH